MGGIKTDTPSPRRTEALLPIHQGKRKLLLPERSPSGEKRTQGWKAGAAKKIRAPPNYLGGGTLEFQQDQGAGTLHNVEIEQEGFVPGVGERR